MLEEAIKYIRALSGYTTVLEPTMPVDAYPSKVVAVPEKSALQSLERFQRRPNRIEHVATLVSSAAFVAYVNRFKNPDTSVYLDIFGEKPAFAAVLDHHGDRAPDWRAHRATFAPKFSLEWQAWKRLHLAPAMDQAALVAFFEDHANDLLSPSPAAMLTQLMKFEEVEKHTYNTHVNLDNGHVQLTYIKGASKVNVTFPHTFDLLIPILENEKPRTLECRLRYRTSEGSVAFKFQFKQDPERMERDELRRLAKEISEGIADAHHYEGVIVK